jgi:exonuclease SbcC
VLITRLYLRNFRVYEDELDLEIPPGLVGIYGPNGAGKSTLLEAILFTLWGKARTTKDQIRSSGVGGDCVTEVEFEHEGHLYLVRRKLKGLNSQVSVEAHCDGRQVSTGTREVEGFVESVLGMDDGAFRASVFTEQKQLAAFSNQAPAERRRLVLQLLGITTLDSARDAARKDARDLTNDHTRLRNMLPDLQELESGAADAEARAAAADVAAREDHRVAAAAGARSEAAVAAFTALDHRRQEHDALVAEGRAARNELDTASAVADARREELRQLDTVAQQLVDLDRQAEGAAEHEALIGPLEHALDTVRRAATGGAQPRPEAPDEPAVADANRAAEELRHELAVARALHEAAAAEADRTAKLLAQSRSLTGEGDCPTCGQSLGDAFANVQAHREVEATEATERAGREKGRVADLTKRSQEADRRADELTKASAAARSALAAWETEERRRLDAIEARDEAWQRAVAAGASTLGRLPAGPPTVADLAAAVQRLKADARVRRAAADQALGIRGRLDTRPGVEKALAHAVEQCGAAAARVENLREKVKALGFRIEHLEAAKEERDRAGAAAEMATRTAQKAAIDAAAERQRATSAAERLAEGRAQHAKLAALESEARHRARAADLLSEFRNTVAASVGPRLAQHAAELFGELTDHEYEKIDVDPETYQLLITDGGHEYGLDRFSGSEIDLANLALRVAISEHIHFESGGSVGLLVLDEVFGPLDEDRKARMLLALERLKGRFRQVLVVTHDTDIKEQLPNAIEVVKQPGRRATARVLGD